MRLARKLFLSFAAITALALGLTAATTSAEVTISPESPAGDPCGTVILTAGHDVTGGCHGIGSSTGNGVPLHAYIPAKTTISNCEVNLEGRDGSSGEGYITQMVFTTAHGGSTPCTRTACDEADGTKIPWPFHVVEHGPANEELEGVICLRPTSNPAGSAGAQCELHLEVNETGTDHLYEGGHADADNGTEIFCENNPPNSTGHPTTQFPISLEVHLLRGGTNSIEINH